MTINYIQLLISFFDIKNYIICFGWAYFFRHRFVWTLSSCFTLAEHTHKNSAQPMNYVGSNCLVILMEEKNSNTLEDMVGCFFFIRDGRKGCDYILTLILGTTVGCVMPEHAIHP